MSRWIKACALLLVLAANLSACVPIRERGWRLSNRRDHALTVWMRRTTVCMEDADLDDEALFEEPELVTIKAQGSIVLSTRSTWFTGDGEPQCGAVWLRSDEYDLDLVLAWDHEPYWDKGASRTPYSVILEGPRDHLLLHVPEELEQLPPPSR
jgi:hypothetical protein